MIFISSELIIYLYQLFFDFFAVALEYGRVRDLRRFLRLLEHSRASRDCALWYSLLLSLEFSDSLTKYLISFVAVEELIVKVLYFFLEFLILSFSLLY